MQRKGEMKGRRMEGRKEEGGGLGREEERNPRKDNKTATPTPTPTSTSTSTATAKTTTTSVTKINIELT